MSPSKVSCGALVHSSLHHAVKKVTFFAVQLRERLPIMHSELS